jgi:hypothetical protein
VLARTGLSAERTSSTIDRLGNTSAASIPSPCASLARPPHPGDKTSSSPSARPLLGAPPSSNGPASAPRRP